MRRKIVTVFLTLLVAVLFFNLYTDHMADDGIRSRWKKLLLNTLVSGDVPRISVGGAHAERSRVLFLDTRARKEYAVSHIEGARFVGYEEFDLRTVNDVPKEQPIVAYCSIGKRSGEIGKKLMDAGFKNVQNLYGGLFEWVNRGYPVVDSENKPTQKVHAFNKLWGQWLNRGEKVY